MPLTEDTTSLTRIAPEHAGEMPGQVSAIVSLPTVSCGLTSVIVALPIAALSLSARVSAFGLTVPTTATPPPPSVNVTGPKSMPPCAPFRSITGGESWMSMSTLAVLEPVAFPMV